MYPCVLEEKEGKGLVNPSVGWSYKEVNPRDHAVLFRILRSLHMFPFSMEKMMSQDISALCNGGQCNDLQPSTSKDQMRGWEHKATNELSWKMGHKVLRCLSCFYPWPACSAMWMCWLTPYSDCLFHCVVSNLCQRLLVVALLGDFGFKEVSEAPNEYITAWLLCSFFFGSCSNLHK